MGRTVHIIGNGDTSPLYQSNANSKGIKLTCNLPPFAIPDAYATTMVDFKMMHAMATGGVNVPGDWILGWRPKQFLEANPNFRVKWMNQVKEFYTVLPDYVPGYTDFNCGHLATHYAANKLQATTVHMYGFDSIFENNMRSYTDLVLVSDRGDTNNYRLINNWRPVWQNMFNEFPETEFILHYGTDKIPFKTGDNVSVHQSTGYRRPKKKK
jgi:hypothetical protein